MASNWLKKLNGIITTLYSDLSIQEVKEKENINKKQIKRATETNYSQDLYKAYKA